MEKILIVDDAEINRGILAAIFEEQYQVIEAEDGDVAIEIIDKESENISLIFLDLIMPKVSGLEVLAHLRYSNLIEKIPVVVVTGETAPDQIAKAYEYGAADVVYKPFSSVVVTRRVMNLLEQYKKRDLMEAELKVRTEEVVNSREQMAKMNEFLLDALGSVVEFRSLESGEHVMRVKYFTKIILEYVKSCYPEFGLTNEQIELMSQAAALHDVGKIAIPDDILKAPRKLTKEEFDEMKKHTIYGCEILEKFKLSNDEFYKYCYDICHWHHEKVDGKGYPDGLRGDEIPIYCQAVSLADCFDALSSKRVYKDQIPCKDAYDMIVAGKCGAFSPVMLNCFEKAKNDLFSAFAD